MRFLPALMALAVVVALAWWFVLRHDATPVVSAAVSTEEVAEETGSKPVPVMVLRSRAEEVTEETTLRGRTQANRTVEVRAETAGLVISEPKRAGTRVAKGDVLCEIAPGSREAQLAEARAAFAEAEAEANAANTLSEKGFTSETTRIARQARLEAAQAALDLVQLDIDRLSMEAPFSGVLETDSAELGERLGVGELCARVIDLGRIKVTAYVSEQDVDRISEGDPVEVRLVNGAERTGEITFISRMADEDTRTYRVEAMLDNADGRLRDGMTAEVRVELPAERAHRIPQLALTLDDEGRLGVRTVEDGVARFHEVRIIRDGPGGVWVSGLPEEVRIIVVGQEFVRDGRALEAVEVDASDLG